MDDAALVLTPLDGPTTIIEMEGTRFLVDPTFDPSGEYPVGSRALIKTTDATWTPEQAGPADAVLLSHDQHPDNLDRSGRDVVAAAPLTLTTPLAAGRLGGTAAGLEPWESRQVGAVTVTAVPAQHGPDGTGHLTGPVTGFVLDAAGLVVYVSGDNASLRLVSEIAERFPRIDVAVLFAGAARTPLVDGYLTLTSAEAAEAADLLRRPRVLPAHTDGWAHFTQDSVSLRKAFEEAGLADLLLDAAPGKAVRL